MRLANSALERMEQAWAETLTATTLTRDASKLAAEFLGHLQSQRVLVGLQVRSDWIRSSYPIFCRSLGVAQPPPYKDFAYHLARQTTRPGRKGRRRIETWQGGQRIACATFYYVPDPAGDVIDLAHEMKRRA